MAPLPSTVSDIAPPPETLSEVAPSPDTVSDIVLPPDTVSDLVPPPDTVSDMVGNISTRMEDILTEAQLSQSASDGDGTQCDDSMLPHFELPWSGVVCPKTLSIANTASLLTLKASAKTKRAVKTSQRVHKSRGMAAC